jgi:hypothetical protein
MKIMVWIDDVERFVGLFMYLFMDYFGTKSLKHLALDSAPSDRWGLSEASMPLASMERGFVRKSGAVDARFVFFC